MISPPFRGLAPFTDTAADERRFFGRERERDLLVANVVAHRLTVLHGESGAGKSSLLRASVVPELRRLAERDVALGRRPHAVVVFAAWPDDPAAALAAAVERAVCEATGDGPDGVPPGRTLHERLRAAAARLDAEVFVLLDQVEELFLYHGADRACLDEIGRALGADDARLHFLLAIRSDGLSELDAFRAAVPGVLANTLRLRHLDEAGARAAIAGALDAYNAEAPPEDRMLLEPHLADAVLDEVGTGRVDVGQARGGRLESANGDARRVETPYLQLVLQRLWDEERSDGSRLLQLSTLRRLGGAGPIVREHLARALEGLDPAQRDLASRVFDHLVTPSGTKIAHTPADLARYAGVPAAELAPVLAELARERVLRGVPGPGGTSRYEIYHDVLADTIVSWTGAHEAELALERERAAARQRQRRLLTLLGAGAVAVVVLLTVAAIAIVQWRRADRDAIRAQARALVAGATAALPTDPQRALRLALDAHRLAPQDGAVAAVLRNAFLGNHGRLVVRAGRAKAAIGAALSPDGRRILTWASPGEARIFDSATGRRLHTLRQGTGIRSAGWSPDGRSVLAVGPDGRALLWDAATARRRLRLGAGVRTAAFAPGGRRIVTGGAGGASLWQTGTGRLLLTLPQADPVLEAVVAPDGRRLATSDLNGLATLWDAGTGRLVAHLGAPGEGRHVAFSADSSTVAAGGGHVVRAFATTDGHRLLTRTSPFGHVLDVALSRRATLLLGAGSDGVARVWRTSDAASVTVLAGHQNLVVDADFSSDGRWAVTASRDTTARVWRLRDGEPRTVLSGHGRPVSSAALTPDLRLVLTAGDDGTARLWTSGIEPDLHVVRRFPGKLVGAAPSADGTQVLVAGPGTTASLVDTTANAVRLRLTEDGPVTAVAMAGDRLATASDGHVTVWSSAAGRPLGVVRPGAPVTAVAFAPDGTLAVGTAAGQVRLYDRGLAELRQLRGAAAPALSLAFSPDGRRLAGGRQKGVTTIHRVADGRLLQSLDGHTDDVLGVAFGPDGSELLTASRDHDVLVWDAGGHIVQTIRAHFALVHGGAFSPDGGWIATAGPGAVGLTSTAPESGRVPLLLFGPTEPVTAVWFAAGGRRIFLTDLDGTLRAYDCTVCASTDHVVALARVRLAHLGSG